MSAATRDEGGRFASVVDGEGRVYIVGIGGRGEMEKCEEWQLS
jgi:hypothetical protein